MKRARPNPFQAKQVQIISSFLSPLRPPVLCNFLENLFGRNFRNFALSICCHLWQGGGGSHCAGGSGGYTQVRPSQVKCKNQIKYEHKYNFIKISFAPLWKGWGLALGRRGDASWTIHRPGGDGVCWHDGDDGDDCHL